MYYTHFMILDIMFTFYCITLWWKATVVQMDSPGNAFPCHNVIMCYSCHYNDVIPGATTSLKSPALPDCLLNRLFRWRSKKTSKLRFTGLCAGNSPVTGEFPAQRASNAEKCFHLMTSSCVVVVEHPTVTNIKQFSDNHNLVTVYCKGFVIDHSLIIATVYSWYKVAITVVDQIHISHNASVPYSTIHYSE